MIDSVATVLTACGIETEQQLAYRNQHFQNVATVLTACGIETFFRNSRNSWYVIVSVATVLTACGIETFQILAGETKFELIVATVLTACGIETGG